MATKNPNLCELCGCDLEVEREMFSQDKLFTGLACKGNISDETVLGVLSSLRTWGIPCFLVKDLTTPELEKQIKGEG